MYIKESEYDQISFTIVDRFIKQAKELKSMGKHPAKFDMDIAINAYLPEKYNEDWTKHNERKLRKYIELEIRMKKAGI